MPLNNYARLLTNVRIVPEHGTGQPLGDHRKYPQHPTQDKFFSLIVLDVGIVATDGPPEQWDRRAFVQFFRKNDGFVID